MAARRPAGRYRAEDLDIGIGPNLASCVIATIMPTNWRSSKAALFQETDVLRSQFLKAGMLGALSALGPVAASAQTAAGFPNRPIRLTVPFPPGGSVDPLARALAQKLSESLGQTVIVDNRAGGNGIIGTELVARAPADGYTLLLASTSHITNSLLMTTSFDALRDFVPVATLSESPVILVVNPSVPANTLQEFIALARAQPTVLNYSSAGTGNPNHLAGEMLGIMAGIQTTHIPYRGGAPAITDLLAGLVQFSFGSTIIVLPHIRAGRLKALAVSSPRRLAALPDVPTFTEAGVPGYEIRIWNAVLAPAATPPDIVARLTTEVTRVMAMPDVKERLDAGGMESLDLTPAQFSALMRSDMEKFERVVRTANVKLE
ncbi:tripartite-type tricarboxylate transporter receptor subunit TctC [Humitalea rosea]|uniref:Tripartite-type tricarboxylate transporter receptor subunit TctC n=1 Tax=Humitalea rosea TaxID=990373 RepID=A0A2W7JTV8_9PROT|nr:tripartite tricarboxylate transporter substrate binding protein [Humitalea rosea]PZW38890.1 tripartite-type tricarboxylate transporter receptor subunit TctC [Humitalea rosea]